MAVSLTKGQNAPLAAGLTNILVGLGWDPRSDAGDAFDLDASCFLLGANGKVRSSRDLVFYKQQQPWGDAIVYGGDNKTGVGDGDDETVVIDLAQIADDVEKLVFTVTIYKATERRQNFGMVDSAFIRVVDKALDNELARFDLTHDARSEKALVFGELYRRDGAWRFRALGDGFDGELQDLARHFGI